MNNKLYVGNLSFDTTQTELENAFSAFGTVQSINLVTDRDTGRPRGFGFIEMGTDSEAVPCRRPAEPESALTATAGS